MEQCQLLEQQRQLDEQHRHRLRGWLLGGGIVALIIVIILLVNL